MPNTRNTIITILVALAATMLWANHATAQVVEVVNEDNPDAECSQALANCEVVAEGESHITALPSGVIVFECHDHYTINWNHDGTGTIHWTGLTESGVGCNAANCEEMSDEWPIHSTTEIAPDTAQIHYEFCLRVLGSHTELECEARINATETSMLHQYEITGTILCAGGARRIEIHALTDSGAIEFVH